MAADPSPLGGGRSPPPSGPVLTALQNLARKEQGHDVDWINIGDALRLAELGLASRGRQGWRISPAGQTALMGVTEDSTSTAPPDATVVSLFSSP